MTSVGIDFGTGNSVLGTYKRDQTQIFEVIPNSGYVPSDVLVNNDGEIDADPAHLIQPKADFHRESAVKRRLLNLSPGDSASRARLMDFAVARLRYLYEALAQRDSEQVVKAVLTCPANAGQAYRDTLLEVGRRVGLPEVSIVDEPTAAAVHHGLSELPVHDERWLVVDWGCGTCDVSLIQRRAREADLVVQCVKGDNSLGGLDMDELLRDHLATQYHFDPAACRLWEVETLKKSLSAQPRATATLTLVGGEAVEVTVTRAELEELIAPLLKQAQDLVTEATDEVRWRRDNLDYVIATGGPMLMPAVREAIAYAVDWDEEDILWRDPLTSVAQGAARLAELKRVGGVVVTNQVAQSIGVRVAKGGNDDAYQRIIQRGEMRPVTGSALLTTSIDLQDIINVELREGDNVSATSNTLLGQLNVVVRPEKKGTVKLKLSVHLTDSSDKEVWIEPVGDPDVIRQLQPLGLQVGQEERRVGAAEGRWSDPVEEFQNQIGDGEVDPDTARQEYERLKIKYHPDRDPNRRDHWNDRLTELDIAFNTYLAEIERRIRASTLPNLPWDDRAALQQWVVDEVLAQRLTHCLALGIGGKEKRYVLLALLKRFPDYRRVLASYLSAMKRNVVLQELLATDDRPHVGLVVLLQNLPSRPLRERHEVLKAAYRLPEDRVREMISDRKLDVEALHNQILKEAPPAVNPVTGQQVASTGAAPPRVTLQFEYRDGNTYISGQTFQVKEWLKKLGCRWDGTNKQWVAHGKHLTEKDVWPNA